MIPTQDPHYTATRLLRLANKAGKPVRIFLGVNPRGGKDRILVAVDDAKSLNKTAPREELWVTPGMHEGTLAASLVAVWSRLGPLLPKTYPRHVTNMQFNPGRRA